MNEERVTKEYKRRHSGYIKIIAHNIIALPVLVPIFGIQWTIEQP